MKKTIMVSLMATSKTDHRIIINHEDVLTPVRRETIRMHAWLSPRVLHEKTLKRDGHDLTPRYKEGEIIEVIKTTTSAVWMVTNLVTKHFGFVEESKRAEALFLEWGKAVN